MMVLALPATRIEVGETKWIRSRPLRPCALRRFVVSETVARFFVIEAICVGRVGDVLTGPVSADLFSQFAFGLRMEGPLVEADQEIVVQVRCVGMSKPRFPSWRHWFFRAVWRRWLADRRVWRAYLRGGRFTPDFLAMFMVEPLDEGGTLERAREAWRNWTESEADREVEPWEDDEDE